jgi:RNA polymerase sigma-70 factor (ECF subfamily)
MMRAVARSSDDPSEVARPNPAATSAWVEAARAGDRRAFARLYRSHGRMVHGVLLARLPRTELRDAMQEVFTAALAKLGDLRDPASFGPWLGSIARNCARDWFKRHGNTRELAHEPSDLEAARATVGHEALADALSLLDAMRGLSEDYREILVLRFVEGLSGAEIAEQLGMTEGSVRVKLHRGMSALRERLHGGVDHE